jgi:prepilin-type processing-associated H-X9-DG protein
MYPEYVPDLNIIVCPSDVGFSKDDLLNPDTGEVDAFRHCADGDAYLPNRGWDTLHGSYVYLAYLFDKIKTEPGLIGPVDMLGGTCDDLIANGTMLTTDQLSSQNAAWSLAIFFNNDGDGILQDFPASVHLKYEDADVEDWRNFVAAPQTAGNGNTDTIFRLREGIERYLITNINNAGGGNEGQSGVWIMWDQTSAFVSGFNHLPGGSNLLYLDGHVEFEKYPGKGPISKEFAFVTGCVQADGQVY